MDSCTLIVHTTIIVYRNTKKTRQFEGGWQSGPSDFDITTLPDSLKILQPQCAYKFCLLHWQNLHLAAKEYSHKRSSTRVNSYIKFQLNDGQIQYACVLYFLALKIQEVWIPQSYSSIRYVVTSDYHIIILSSLY